MSTRDLDRATLTFLREEFNHWDVDSSGTIDTKELGALMRSLHVELSAVALRRVLDKFDIDHNGSLDFNEFVTLMRPYFTVKPSEALSARQLKDMKRLFSKFDRNGDGCIDTVELGDLLRQKGQRVTESQVRNILALYDRDNSGSLSFEEFTQMILCPY